MTPPVLTVFPEDSITVVLVVVSALEGGREGVCVYTVLVRLARNLNASRSTLASRVRSTREGSSASASTRALDRVCGDASYCSSPASTRTQCNYVTHRGA